HLAIPVAHFEAEIEEHFRSSPASPQGPLFSRGQISPAFGSHQRNSTIPELMFFVPSRHRGAYGRDRTIDTGIVNFFRLPDACRAKLVRRDHRPQSLGTFPAAREEMAHDAVSTLRPQPTFQEAFQLTIP